MFPSKDEDAQRVAYNLQEFIQKTFDDKGVFKTLLWRNKEGSVA